MGLLMIKVGGQWVPYAPASTVGPPAYAGADRSIPLTTGAQFTHLNMVGGWNGFMVYSDGWVEANYAAGKAFSIYEAIGPDNKPTGATQSASFTKTGLRVADIAEIGLRGDGTAEASFQHVAQWGAGQAYGFQCLSDAALKAHVGPSKDFVVWHRNPANTAFQATFMSTHPRTIVGTNFAIGDHPQHAVSDWVAGYSKLANDNINGGEYTFLVGKPSTGVAGMTLFNAWNNLQLRVANTMCLSIESGQTRYTRGPHEFEGGSLRGHFQTSATDWTNWPVLAWSAPGYSSFSGVHGDGTGASAWRIYPGQGEALYAVNWNNTLHTPVGGLRFDTMSSATIKRDIRSLRPEREHVVVQPLTPGADTVMQPDIMALRPTVFRLKGKVQRPVQVDGEWEGEDYPDDNWIQRVRTREVLGLIAEEVQYVVPSAVIHNEDGDPIALDYNQIVVALLDHVQELTRTVETMRYRITELENA